MKETVQILRKEENAEMWLTGMTNVDLDASLL